MALFEEDRTDSRGRKTGGERSPLAYLIRSGLLALFFVLFGFLVPAFAHRLTEHSHAPFAMLAAVWRWPGQAGIMFIWGALGALLVSVVLLPLCFVLLPVALVTQLTGTPIGGAIAAGFVAAILPPFRKLFPVVWIIRLFGVRTGTTAAPRERKVGAMTEPTVHPGVRILSAVLFAFVFHLLGQTRAVPEIFYTLFGRTLGVFGAVCGFISQDEYPTIGSFVTGALRLVAVLIVGLIGLIISLVLVGIGWLGKTLHENQVFFLLGLPVGYTIYEPLRAISALLRLVLRALGVTAEVAYDLVSVRTWRGRFLSAGFLAIVGAVAIYGGPCAVRGGRGFFAKAVETSRLPEDATFHPMAAGVDPYNMTVTVTTAVLTPDRLALTCQFKSVRADRPINFSVNEESWIRDELTLQEPLYLNGSDRRMPLGREYRLDPLEACEGTFYFPRPQKLSVPFTLMLKPVGVGIAKIDLRRPVAPVAGDEPKPEGLVGTVLSCRLPDRGNKNLILDVTIRLDRGGELTFSMTPDCEIVGHPVPDDSSLPWSEHGKGFMRVVRENLKPGTSIAVLTSGGGDEGITYAQRITILGR